MFVAALVLLAVLLSDPVVLVLVLVSVSEPVTEPEAVDDSEFEGVGDGLSPLGDEGAGCPGFWVVVGPGFCGCAGGDGELALAKAGSYFGTVCDFDQHTQILR